MQIAIGTSLIRGGLSLSAQVAAMFASGEQGAWYDPSNTASLYQDSVGTVPVTAVGQPVGLMLDTRFGLVRNAEQLANPSFDSGSAGWSVSGADATHVVTFAGGTMRYQSDTTSPVLSLSNPGGTLLGAGKTYEIVVDVVSVISNGGVKSDMFPGIVFASAAGIQKFRAVCLSNSTFAVYRNDVGVDVTINSISVREIPGNHATQATATARPLLQQDAGGKRYLAFDGVDDYLNFPAITPSDGVLGWAVAGTPATGNQVILSPAAPGYLTGWNGFWAWNDGGNIVSSSVPVKARQALSFLTDGSITGTYADSAGASGAATRGGTMPALRLIGTFDGSAAFMTLNLYGMVIRAAHSTQAQAMQVRAYLASQLGAIT